MYFSDVGIAVSPGSIFARVKRVYVHDQLRNEVSTTHYMASLFNETKSLHPTPDSSQALEFPKVNFIV